MYSLCVIFCLCIFVCFEDLQDVRLFWFRDLV